jgi:hypothetical protein
MWRIHSFEAGESETAGLEVGPVGNRTGDDGGRLALRRDAGGWYAVPAAGSPQ